MNVDDVKPGLRVRITKLGETIGYLVKEKHLTCRCEGQTGVVGGYIPGHGGDVYWVDHEDGTTGAYAYDEFEPIEPIMKVKPITPAEVTDKKLKVIPDGVIEAFNELIAENWDGHFSAFTQKAVTQRIKEKMKHQSFDIKWLDVEPIFEEIGWRVEYDKPGYNESYPAAFTFEKREKKVLRG